MTSEYKLAELSNGVRLAYVEQGDPGGVPVVLLHGLSDSLHSFDLLRPLLPRAWRVFAVTLRGHGGSDKPEQGYAMPMLAADVAAFLDAFDIERAVLVGHSLSTSVVLQTAANYPERVAAIALIGAFGDTRDNPGVQELRAAVREFEKDCGAAFAREFQESTLASPIPADFLDLAVSETLRMPAHAWRGVAEGFTEFDPANAASRCRAPAMIIWGDKDAYCPREDQLMLRNVLSSSRLFTLANVGHAVHWERPADVAALLRAFVAEIEDAGNLAHVAA
jgi:pimeloyl-ACP methyl ester carboxylesterase